MANEIRNGDTVRILSGRASGRTALVAGLYRGGFSGDEEYVDAGAFTVYVTERDNDNEYIGYIVVKPDQIERVETEWTEFKDATRRAAALLTRFWGVKAEQLTNSIRNRMGH